ncbi:Phosphatidylinositol phosphatase PTPRQ [Erysiphe necator]|nr:Phosphatidylinositol phosphatase PTPRQ [Erysiphe necator]
MAFCGNDKSNKSSENKTHLNHDQYMAKVDGNEYLNCRLPVFLTLSPNVISHKFNLISQYEATLAAKPSAILSHVHLSQRDRYINIRPWAHNAIQLKNARKFPDNYINASPISLGRNQEIFIATQGPGPGDTILHFWQMIWQERAEVIVMLTKFVEDGTEKCGVYMPLQKADVLILKPRTGPVWGKVECETLQKEDWGEIRQLRIMKNSESQLFEERLVYHLLFMRWPDHKVPREKNDQMALINLINLSREKMSHNVDSPKVNTPPRIIHCSAGVGRTGTFIALDHLLHELEENKLDYIGDEDDPILNTVQRLREQRMGLVNNVQQYALIYQILRERWELRRTHIFGTASVMRDHKVSSAITNHMRLTSTLKRKFQNLSRK